MLSQKRKRTTIPPVLELIVFQQPEAKNDKNKLPAAGRATGDGWGVLTIIFI